MDGLNDTTESRSRTFACLVPNRSWRDSCFIPALLSPVSARPSLSLVWLLSNRDTSFFPQKAHRIKLQAPLRFQPWLNQATARVEGYGCACAAPVLFFFLSITEEQTRIPWSHTYYTTVCSLRSVTDAEWSPSPYIHTYLSKQSILGPVAPPFSFCHPTSRHELDSPIFLPWRTTRNMDLQGTGSVGPTNTGRDLRLELPKLDTPRPVR
ncbi:hypothetical protein GE21DRAFT_1099452 [Neurospora crassa]|nr:hypothetical protein GE21DRAFT_1099452 [Neurospora crassa]